MDVLEKLRALADPDDAYREFTRRIVATNYEIAGVRTPVLRKLVREIAADPRAAEYLERGLDAAGGRGGAKPTHEEVLLYGMVLAARSRKMALEDVFRLLERLIPRFDSWAHVDMIVSDFKLFALHREAVLGRFLPLKTHPGEFEKRTFVVLLMDFFLDREHIGHTLEELAGVPQGQYYVDMAIAWALAEALVKHPDLVEPLLQRSVFSRFVHNKAIQKARESYRISPERKEYLKSLKK